MNNNADVTAYISTKDRYFTTLTLAISSIATQTVLPKKFILFEDSEPVDIRTTSVYLHLLHLLNEKGIEWEVVFGKKLGQVHNHQKAIEMCKTEWLWRLDDDNIAESNVLENLLKCTTEKTGAVAGLVIDPTQIKTNTDVTLNNSIKSIYDAPNVQWMKQTRTDVFKVEHLYSSFIYRRAAAKHGYATNLSPAGHREETIFSHEMYRAGWDLYVNPNVVTWHLREPTGGIRSHNDKSYWDSDEEFFKKKMKDWSGPADTNFYIILDNGLGDHFVFSSLIPELKKKHGDKLVIAACYPSVFEKFDVKIISIAAAKGLLGDIEIYNIYRYCGMREWTKPLIDAFKEMYL